jgi:RNA polymerase sigma-70 factor (ECF subfamily)
MMGLMAEPLFTSRTDAMQAEAGRAEAELLRDFGTWMTAEQKRVYAICYRMLQDPDEADSATQDAFLKAYQALQKENAKALDDPGRWLSRIAVNTCLDRLRSRKWQFWRRRPQAADETMILAMARSKTPEGEQQLLASEIGVRLNAALARLSDRQRAVFTLRHHEDMSLEEIGAALGLDVGTVKAHMFRAVGKLRQELKDLYEGGRP